MFGKEKMRALSGAAILGMAAAFSGPAAAANDAMLDLLKLLRDKGSISAEEYDLLAGAAKADDEQNTGAATEIKAAAATLPKVTTEGKLEIAKPNGDFSWRLGGRLHYDNAWYDNDKGIDAAGDTRSTSLASGSEIRRARMDVTANVWRVWQFKLQYDFTDSGAAGFRDAYVRYLFKGAHPGQITVGNFKEPYSLEELNSSNDDMFLEQSLTEIFYPSRRVGISGNFWGNDLWTVHAGIFGETTAVSGSQPSCGASVNASDGVISTCTGNDSEGYAFSGRVTASPFHTADSSRVLHLGFAGSHREPDDGNAFSFAARPESRVGRDALISTGTIKNVDSTDRFGVEVAGNYGPASLQGEYFYVDVNREEGSDDVNFDGWYIQGSWHITGETRPYKFEEATFSNPRPLGTVGSGGIGAWEVVARYSTVDLFDSGLSTCTIPDRTNTCGEEDNFTVGLNWYPTPNMKFMAHFVQVLDLDGGNFDGAEPSAFQVRSQVHW